MLFITKGIARFDAYQQKHGLIGFPLAVVKKYGDDEAGHQAALLAYYGFLSLFPLLLVLTTVVKLFLSGEGELQHKVLNGVTTYIPVIGDQLNSNVHSLHGAGLALTLGVVLTLFGARGVADAFRGAVNHVWQVPYARRTSFPKSIGKSLGIVVVGGFGLISAPIIAGYAVSFGHNAATAIGALLLTALLLFVLFVFLAKTALAQPRKIRDIWVGALVAAIGLMVLQTAGTYLLTHQLHRLQDLYSTFAIVLGLLFWLYLQTQLLLYAIEIDTVRTYKLWPRSLNKATPTEADLAAYKLYAKRNSWDDQYKITVEKQPKKRPLLERLRDLGHDDAT